MINFFKHLNPKNKLTLIVALIAATASVVSAAIGISVQKQILEFQVAINNCNNSISNIESKISSINTNVNTLNTYYAEAEKTDKSLMEEAIHAYNAEEYLRVIELYSNEKISNTPIVLTNIGYLYENGYGVTQDFSKAEEYYNKAIAQGYEEAYTHKMTMYFTYCLSGIENIIYEGYERNSEVLANFLSSFYILDSLDKFEFLDIFCNYYTSEEQLDFLYNNVWEWENMGYVTYTIPPKSCSYERYELANAFTSWDPPSINHVYRHYKISTHNLSKNEFITDY